jgi:hypothetical protein
MSSGMASGRRIRTVSDPVLILPVVVAATLIVVGRVSHRRRWGNRVAVAGYATLAIMAVLALAARVSST